MDRKVKVYNKDSVCISQKTQCASTTKTNWWMPYVEMIVYSQQSHGTHKYTLWVQYRILRCSTWWYIH
jgi:hypothetical protein